jgi:hypothetical protein
MPELDPKSPEYKRTIGIALVIGLVVGLTVMAASWDSEASGGLCWMSGCFSAFIVWLVGVYTWGKQTSGPTPTRPIPYERPRVVTPPRTRPATRPAPAPAQPVRRPPPTPSTPTTYGPTRNEVIKAIEQLPEGLPESLWRKDWNKIADAVASGERISGPQGQPIVHIDDKWYYADINDPSTFLKEWGT